MANTLSGVTATTTVRPRFFRNRTATTYTSEIVISAQVLGRTVVDGIPGWLTGNARRTINFTVYPNNASVPWYNDSPNLAKLSMVGVDSSPINKDIQYIGGKIRNEFDAAKPLAVLGGAGNENGCKLLHENGYDKRSGSNGKLTKHSQKYHQSRDVVRWL